MITFNYTSDQNNVLQNAKNLVQSTVNQYIVRPLDSPNLIGVSGFLFDIIDDEEIIIESMITDNYVEDNYAVQDHVSLKPVRFTLRGYVGEITNAFQEVLAQIFIATQALPTVGGLFPQFNVQDTQFYAKTTQVAQAAQNVVNQANNLYSLFSDASTTANKQEKAFQYFYQMWKTRQLCVVETPFGVFDSMAIETLRALQSGQNNEIADFTITFKQIRTTSSITLTPQTQVTSGRLQQMTAPLTNLAKQPGSAINGPLVFSTFTNQAQS